MTRKEEDTTLDPLEEVYREKLTEADAVTESVQKGKTALLCIDLQGLDAMPGRGLFQESAKSDATSAAQEYYFSELHNRVIPNTARLQKLFRENGLEVIHSRIQSLTEDGRDRSSSHKRLEIFAPPGSPEAEFIEGVKPIGDEIVINKTASGVFSSTNLEYVLRNLGVTGLFVCGVFTNECVSSAVRGGCDLGFFVTLIAEACAAVTPELHESTIKTLENRYARILTLDQAIQEILSLNL